MKKLLMTEKEFKTFLLECVYNVLSETYLLEYLVKRKNFVELCRDLSHQIIENWCLVHYVTLTSDKAELKEHWKDELHAYLQRLNKLGIKNNDVNTRFKAAKEGFKQYDLYDSVDNIISLVDYKFKKENINDINIIKQVCVDCFKSLDEIVDVIASYGDNKKMNTYIENI